MEVMTDHQPFVQAGSNMCVCGIAVEQHHPPDDALALDPEPDPVEFHSVHAGTVQQWLRDIERYKASNARLLAALKEARDGVAGALRDLPATVNWRSYVANTLPRIDAVLEEESP